MKLDPGDGAAGERLLTAREVAELLGIAPATVLDWFEAGRLPGFKIGGTERGRVRFRLSEIEATLEVWREGPLPLAPDRRERDDGRVLRLQDEASPRGVRLRRPSGSVPAAPGPGARA